MPNKSTSRGWRRYRELRAKDDADRKAIAAGIIGELGRRATVVEQVAAENLAALIVWARTLERRGQHAAAAKVRQQVTQAQRATNFKPAPPAPAKPQATSPLEYWRAKQAQASSAQADEPAYEQRRDEAPLGALPGEAGA
jgi:hypothetical protein